MNAMDSFLLILFLINIIKLIYCDASKFSEVMGWTCAIFMLIKAIT